MDFRSQRVCSVDQRSRSDTASYERDTFFGVTNGRACEGGGSRTCAKVISENLSSVEVKSDAIIPDNVHEQVRDKIGIGGNEGGPKIGCDEFARGVGAEPNGGRLVAIAVTKLGRSRKPAGVGKTWSCPAGALIASIVQIFPNRFGRK